MQNQNLSKEKELLQKAQIDPKNFEELYKYYLNDVYRYSYSILNNAHDAEDITSQTFLKLYQNLQKLEWKDISLKFWLLKVARNECYSKFRKPILAELDENIKVENELEISFVDEIMDKDLVERVKKEILLLSPLDQEIINLRIWEGLQFDQIAEIQNSKLSTVKLRFYRAIEKLKKQIEDKHYVRSLAFPMLFTGIKQAGALPAFNPTEAFIASATNTILQQTTMTPTILTSIQTFLATKAGIAVATTVIATTAIAGGAGVYLYSNNNTNNTQNSAQIDPQPESPHDFPSPTATQVNEWKRIEIDKQKNIYFEIPSNWNQGNVNYIPESKLSFDISDKDGNIFTYSNQKIETMGVMPGCIEAVQNNGIMFIAPETNANALGYLGLNQTKAEPNNYSLLTIFPNSDPTKECDKFAYSKYLTTYGNPEAMSVRLKKRSTEVETDITNVLTKNFVERNAFEKLFVKSTSFTQTNSFEAVGLDPNGTIYKSQATIKFNYEPKFYVDYEGTAKNKLLVWVEKNLNSKTPLTIEVTYTGSTDGLGGIGYPAAGTRAFVHNNGKVIVATTDDNKNYMFYASNATPSQIKDGKLTQDAITGIDMNLKKDFAVNVTGYAENNQDLNDLIDIVKTLELV